MQATSLFGVGFVSIDRKFGHVFHSVHDGVWVIQKQIEVAEARHHKLKEQIKQMSVDIEHFAPQRTKLKCDRDDKKQAFKLKQVISRLNYKCVRSL